MYLPTTRRNPQVGYILTLQFLKTLKRIQIHLYNLQQYIYKKKLPFLPLPAWSHHTAAPGRLAPRSPAPFLSSFSVPIFSMFTVKTSWLLTSKTEEGGRAHVTAKFPMETPNSPPVKMVSPSCIIFKTVFSVAYKNISVFRNTSLTDFSSLKQRHLLLKDKLVTIWGQITFENAKCSLRAYLKNNKHTFKNNYNA